MLTWYDVKPDNLCTKSRMSDIIRFLSRVRRQREIQRKLIKRSDKTISADLFNAFYKPDVALRDRDKMPNPALGAWMEQLQDTEEYKDLRLNTIHDADASVVASVKFHEEYMRRQESFVKTAQQLEGSKTTARAYADSDPEQAQNVIDNLTQAQEILGGQLDDYGLDAREEGRVDGAITAAVEALEMAEILAQFDTAGKGIGSGEGDTLKYAFDNRITSKFKNQDTLRKIAKLMGRFKKISEGVKSEKIGQYSAPTKIVQGDELSRVVPSELAMYAMKETEGLFLKKYTEKSLMQYDVKDNEKQGKGPFVVLLDKSGSMRGMEYEVAAAITAELLRLALEDHREAAVIPFDGRAHDVRVIDSSDKLIDFMMYGLRASGGTNFDNAFNAGLDYISKQKLDKSDIMIITDGMGNVHQTTEQWMRVCRDKAGVRYFGLNIREWGAQWPDNLEKLMQVTASVNYRQLTNVDKEFAVLIEKIIS